MSQIIIPSPVDARLFRTGKAKKKQRRQRVCIYLTDTKTGGFGIDIVHEPSIKGRELTAEVRHSMACTVAREVCQHVLSRYDKKIIAAP